MRTLVIRNKRLTKRKRKQLLRDFRVDRVKVLLPNVLMAGTQDPAWLRWRQAQAVFAKQEGTVRKRAKREPVINIKTVSFRSSIQLAQFQHVHVEATADVPPGVDPETVMERVKAYVAWELRVAKEGRAAVPKPGRFRDMLTIQPRPADPRIEG